MQPDTSINRLGHGWIPEGGAPSSPGCGGSGSPANDSLVFDPKARDRAALSQLEALPSHVTWLIYGYLPERARTALGKTSWTMHTSKRVYERDLAAKVDALLKKPHAERTLKNLVDIGLLPSGALKYGFSERKLGLLLSGNVIKGLHLNKLAGVDVNLSAFAHIPSDWMPDVRGGEAELECLLQKIFTSPADEKTRLKLKNGTRVTIASQVIQSKVLANVVCNGKAAFEACLSICWLGPNLDLAEQWAKTLHPDLLNPRAGSGNGSTCSNFLFRAVRTCQSIVKILLEQRANFNICDDNGRTPLMLASSAFRQQEIVSLLLNAGVDVNWSDREGQTALGWAARSLDPENTALLIKSRSDVNHRDHSGRNILHRVLHTDGDPTVPSVKMFAEGASRIEVVQLLLDAGADVFQRDHKGKLPVDYLMDELRRGSRCFDLLNLVIKDMRKRRPGFDLVFC